jgi:hypothetical protein
MIGEIEFKVIGSYSPNNDILSIEYDEIIATVLTDGDLVDVDGRVLLDSFDAWDDFETKVTSALEAEEDALNAEDEEDIDTIQYTELDEDDEN